MTVHYRTKGFVFKKRDSSEADRVFSIFTDDFGRLEVTARAIRKINSKLRGGIDVFSLSEIEFIQGKNQKTLTDATFIKRINNDKLWKNKIANLMSDVLDNFVKGQEKDEKIFQLIESTLNNLNDKVVEEKNSAMVFYYFLWNLLSILGYCPEINKCVACQNKLSPDNLYFSNEDGGVMCKDCFNKNNKIIRINSDVVKIIRLILNNNWPIVSKIKAEDYSKKLFKDISHNYYSYILSSHKNVLS